MATLANKLAMAADPIPYNVIFTSSIDTLRPDYIIEDQNPHVSEKGINPPEHIPEARIAGPYL